MASILNYFYQQEITTERVDWSEIWGGPRLRLIYGLTYLNLICTTCLSVCILNRYLIGNKWMRAKKLISPLDTIFNTGFYKTLLVEVVFNWITPLPFFVNIKVYEYYQDFNAKVEYELNDLLLCFSLFYRLYLLLRVTLTTTKFR